MHLNNDQLRKPRLIDLFGSLLIFFVLLPFPIAPAAPITLWQIGDDEDPYAYVDKATDEFAQAAGRTDIPPGAVTRIPGDPLYDPLSNSSSDDHFYLAGTYPAGFNGLTGSLDVPNPEPTSAFERTLNNTEPTNFIHFQLTPDQVNAQSRLRLSFELVGGFNPARENFGTHNIIVRFQNSIADTLVLQRHGIDRDTRFTIDIPAASVKAVAGANTIQFTRTGPTFPADISTGVLFDFVKMEVDTDALADEDGDGLPRWWEEDNQQSDINPNDANADADGDTLSSLQEYNGGVLMSDPRNRDTDADGADDSMERAAGSNPNLRDTDNDGLTDRDELLIAPTSSPLLTDSDGDTSPDGWEKRVGSDPTSAASTPPSFSGAIGINFVSKTSPGGLVDPHTPAGVVPQLFWNNTIPLGAVNRLSGSTSEIATPNPGWITRSDGQLVSGARIKWTSDSTTATNNDGSPDQRLMNGYLSASAARPASVTISGIPFPSYHIYAYVGGGNDGQKVSVMLNAQSSTTRTCYTMTTPPRGAWVEIPPSTQANPANYGNFVRYPTRTGSSVTINTRFLDGFGRGAGLHAIQIVDATLDADLSGIPDWYEMQYALQPVTAATKGEDPDGDVLTNLEEFQRGSNPLKSDTDGDGLADNTETAENALSADSDADGLSDYAETNAPLPSDPNHADSDRDGLTDKRETELGFDPSVKPVSRWVPVYKPTTARWEWNIEPVQIVWDHSAGAIGGNDGFDRTLFAIYTNNTLTNNTIDKSIRSLEMGLRYINGSLTYEFTSLAKDAFSAANDPLSSIDLIDEKKPPTDLKAALGFSGYGTADISDLLRFRMLAARGSGNVWSITFEIFNITRNTTVVSRLVSQSTAAPSVDGGTAAWQNIDLVPQLSSFELYKGSRLFISPTPLETLPEFRAHEDTDNDGIPNAWEERYGFDKSLGIDAIQDADGDGLNNRDEWIAGTDPLLTDTDRDNVDDRLERVEGSNPLLGSVRPPFADGAAASGSDFNKNRLPDAWEIRFKTQGISASGDNDGDGASNATEAAWGTDPFDAASQITLTVNGDGNDALLEWTRNRWKRQRIHQSLDLASWQPISTPFSHFGANSTTRLINQFTTAPGAFYTVETKDLDSDGDGVADWDEVATGSNPFLRDSARSSAVTLDSEGNVTGSVSGDYAAFAGLFRNGLPGGPGGQVTREQAARFLQQASFGPTMADLDRVQTLGFAGWIDDQIANQPTTLHRPVIEAMLQDLRGPKLDLSYYYDELDLRGPNISTAFARAAIAGPDQLRQRVAFALSQILVVSRRDPRLGERPVAMTDFHDILVRNAFGNYRDILGEVSMHPVMGVYLSHVGNQKARPEFNQFPDENYARELMQLFTIGLWELNPDGSHKLDAAGNSIPTYGNRDIAEIARVFTGFWFGGHDWNRGGNFDHQLTVPMGMWAEKHDFEAKSMLGGLSIPARPPSVANGLRDVNDTLDFLFNHPNTGVFIGRQLIQFLVTSNPSPEYVARVSAVFANNGSGKRGDLAAVIRAILLDPEARDVTWSHGSTSYGRLKDPVYRAINLARAGRLDRYPTLNWWDFGGFYESSLQSPGYSPSVFSFYRPDYRPPGLLTENHLAGPAFQIMNSYSCISFVNRLWKNTVEGFSLATYYSYTPDYKDLLEVAGTPPLLVDRVNLLFCGGMMSAATRAQILNALSQTPASDPLMRVQLSVFIASACPEGAIQR